MRALRLTAAVVLAVAVATDAPGHGALQEQLAEATAALASDPASVPLLLRRGELHRAHEDFDAALADLDRAAALAPGDDAIDFLRGRALQQAGRAAAARVALDRYLARHPHHVDALVTRARALRTLGEYDGAVADFTLAIDGMPRPDPDVCLERARVEIARGEIHQAIAGLDAAILRAGPVPSLQMFALDVERKLGRTNAALGRLDRIAAPSPRKETWLARRGEILAGAGRTHEARAAYASALDAIEALPAGTRRTPAVAELETRVRGALAALPADAAQVNRPTSASVIPRQ